MGWLLFLNSHWKNDSIVQLFLRFGCELDRACEQDMQKTPMIMDKNGKFTFVTSVSRGVRSIEGWHESCVAGDW